jgi:hypothetical protein
VTTTTLRGVVCWFDFVPLLGLEVEDEEIVESDSLIVNTTMATKKIDLSV